MHSGRRVFQKDILATLARVALSIMAAASLLRSQTKPQTDQRVPPQASGTIRVTVREVVVDVVVTGSHGQLVEGLRPEDFEVTDDGHLQHLRSLTEHRAPSSTASKLPILLQLHNNAFSNYSPIPQDASLGVVLIDVGNTPWCELPYIRQQVSKFLRKDPLESQFGIFIMAGGWIHMVQGFTGDRDLLLAALDSREVFSRRIQATLNPFTKGMGPVKGEFASAKAGEAASRAGPGGEQGGPAQVECPVAAVPPGSSSQMSSTEPQPPRTTARADLGNNIQARNTLRELDQLAEFLEGIPGRKNLFWFSGSLPRVFSHCKDTSNNVPDLLRSGRLLERSRTTVYAIDADGLQASVPTSGSWAVSTGVCVGHTEQLTLESLAEETGGRAFYNTNGFAEAMAAGVREGENYYTLTYSPSNAKFNGELRHIRVALRRARANYELHYRRSYYADASDAAPQRVTDPLAFNLQHGAPTAQQILFWGSFSPRTSPSAGEAESDPPPAEPSADPALPSPDKDPKGETVRKYIVRFVVAPGGLTLTESNDGKRRVKLQFASSAFDREGRLLQSFSAVVTVTLEPEVYRRVQAEGLRLYQELAIPTQAVSLRLAVRDVASDRVGSLEVPLPLPTSGGSAELHR